MSDRTIIVGGGLAGLAAAVALADRGVLVQLFESRPRLGGRASSFFDSTTGTQIDNCQHVSMGCCTNFQHFCQTVGIDRHFRREAELNFIGPDCRDGDGKADGPRINRFAASVWPAPLHLLPAFRRLDYLSNRDKWQLAKGLRVLAATNPASCDQQTFAEWLDRHEQTPATIERFWHVVLVSALSESLERISVPHARKVFVDAFMANRRGWEVSIPTVPLDDLYGGQLTDWLTQRGVAIRLQAGVKQFNVEDDAVIGVELRDGESLAADQFVLAVPHHLVRPMLPPGLADHPDVTRLGQLESAPIASVHLWFDRAITDLPHAVFVARLSQWMFNRSVLQGDSNQHSYQIVISAARHLAGQSQDQIITQVVDELAHVWPAVAEAELLHGRLVTEHRAVFSVQPGADSLRPSQQSPIDNLQFAGDWTNTGWPGTMESAVRSGYLAAENILRKLGRPQRVLQPDLPVSLLSKLLLRL